MVYEVLFTWIYTNKQMVYKVLFTWIYIYTNKQMVYEVCLHGYTRINKWFMRFGLHGYTRVNKWSTKFVYMDIHE